MHCPGLGPEQLKHEESQEAQVVDPIGRYWLNLQPPGPVGARQVPSVCGRKLKLHTQVPVAVSEFPTLQTVQAVGEHSEQDGAQGEQLLPFQKLPSAHTHFTPFAVLLSVSTCFMSAVLQIKQLASDAAVQD